MTLHRITVVTLAVLAVLVLFLVVLPWAQEELEPELVGAWVAVELGESGGARVGTLRTSSLDACALHAVLEARDRNGEPVYYTEAESLEIPDQEVPQEALRRWDRGQAVKLLWFTVEGQKPYWEMGAEGLAGFSFEPSFRADWPRTWSIPCILDSSNPAFAQGFESLGPQRFGTQRYQVRIELWGTSQIAPEVRFTSVGGEELLAAGESFPGLIVALPGALGPASEVFGLTQVAPTPEADARARELLSEWSRRRLVFSRNLVLAELLRVAGGSWESIVWSEADLNGGAEESAPAFAPGDLVRVGERVVLLYEDRGLPGRLDREDLAFDYTKGPGIRPLAEIFVGDGLVEWARLAPAETESR